MRKRVLSAFLAISLAAGLTACAPSAGKEGNLAFAVKPVAFKASDSLSEPVSHALGEFSLDLFRRLAAQDTGKNVFVSPLSVWLALGMTYNGAAGSTTESMAKALHAVGIPLDDLNRDNAGLMGVLTAADTKVKTAIANSVWMRKNFVGEFSKDFIERDQQYYVAQVQALDFSNAAAPDTINKWVEDNTNGNIKNLIEPPISKDAVMFLINAVHFKAPWKNAFDKKATANDAFRSTGDKTVIVPFMNSPKDNCTYVDDSVVAARIPYASGRIEMAVLMPLRQTLDDFIKGMTVESLNESINRCEQTSVALMIPKFQVEYKALLNDSLAAMGMDEAFRRNGADFTKMSESRGKQIYISKVQHKSFIQVDEEGTEASAASVVEMECGSAMPQKPAKFDHPFVYLIRDTKTGAILFIGAMENPT